MGFESGLMPESGFPTLEVRRESPDREWIRQVLLSEDDSTADRGERLLCRSCRSPVTSTSEIVSIGGSRAHRRSNPGGYEYDFACFRAAPGADNLGEPTTEFSWFPGYAWRLAACGSCGVHLGWYFSGRTPHFFGLIIDRIVGEDHRTRSS
jgi:hypothetical protein